MAAGQNWKCNNCGYRIQTSANWEFYRDSRGRLRPHKRLVPPFQPAEKTDIKGYFVKWYCHKCREVKEAVSIERGKVAVKRYQRVSEVNKDVTYFTPLCSKCRTELKEEPDKTDICPQCNKGIFEEVNSWIS